MDILFFLALLVGALFAIGVALWRRRRKDAYDPEEARKAALHGSGAPGHGFTPYGGSGTG
jgi:hypothetical protein